MPVMPSFSAFAPTPNVAQSFLGGARIAQEAQQHAQQFQMQREKLQQDAIQAEMELSAKKEAAQAQQLRQQQEMEIDKAYQQAQIGLKQRSLDAAAKSFELKTQDAARKMMVQQQYQKRFNELSATIPADQASRQAILEINPAMFGGAGTAAVKPPVSVTDFGGATELPGAPGMLQAQTGAGSRRIFAAPITEPPVAKPIAGTEDYIQIGKQVVRKPDATRELRQEVKKLEAAQEKDTPGKMAFQKASDPSKKLTVTEKLMSDTFSKRASTIEKLQGQIEAMRSRSIGATIPQGLNTRTGTSSGSEAIRKTKDGRRAVFNADTKEFIRYAD